MRGYSVGATALALSVSSKWLDNLLSQNMVAGVTQSRQGVQRRLTSSALYVISTVHNLNREFHIPVATALRLAHELWGNAGNNGFDDVAVLQVGGIVLQVNRGETKARVEAALAEALEMAPRTRRGRPRKRTPIR